MAISKLTFKISIILSIISIILGCIMNSFINFITDTDTYNNLYDIFNIIKDISFSILSGTLVSSIIAFSQYFFEKNKLKNSINEENIKILKLILSSTSSINTKVLSYADFCKENNFSSDLSEFSRQFYYSRYKTIREHEIETSIDENFKKYRDILNYDLSYLNNMIKELYCFSDIILIKRNYFKTNYINMLYKIVNQVKKHEYYIEKCTSKYYIDYEFMSNILKVINYEVLTIKVEPIVEVYTTFGSILNRLKTFYVKVLKCISKKTYYLDGKIERPNIKTRIEHMISIMALI